MGNPVISVDPNPYNQALLFNSLGITVDEICLLYTFDRDAAIFTTSMLTVQWQNVVLAKRTFCQHLYIQINSAVINTSNSLIFSPNKNFDLPGIHPKIPSLHELCQNYIQNLITFVGKYSLYLT